MSFHNPSNHVNLRQSLSLFDLPDNRIEPGMKGYYRRPSRAIEKGGGFFIPGLEDEKIRIVAVAILFAMLTLNSVGSPYFTFQLAVSDAITVVTSLLLLVISVSPIIQNDLEASNQPLYISKIQSSVNNDNDVLEITARGLLNTCEGVNYVLIVTKEQILLEFGPLGKKVASWPSVLSMIKEIENKQRIDEAGHEPSSYKVLETSTLKSSEILSEDTQSVLVVKANSGLIWVVGAATGVQLEAAQSWIVSLSSVPLRIAEN